MTESQMNYYHKMLLRDRLIPITKEGIVIGFITYYIGKSEDLDKYIRDNPWSVVDDEPESGNTCYIDQMITNKESNNHVYSWQVYNMLCSYIEERYPQVTTIRWNRHKGGKTRVYNQSIRG